MHPILASSIAAGLEKCIWGPPTTFLLYGRPTVDILQIIWGCEGLGTMWRIQNTLQPNIASHNIRTNFIVSMHIQSFSKRDRPARQGHGLPQQPINR
eukprot:5582233-Amphidinium_carterae.1